MIFEMRFEAQQQRMRSGSLVFAAFCLCAILLIFLHETDSQTYEDGGSGNTNSSGEKSQLEAAKTTEEKDTKKEQHDEKMKKMKKKQLKKKGLLKLMTYFTLIFPRRCEE